MMNKELGREILNLTDDEQEFLPRNEVARLAVLKSREIVRKNNEYIQKIKEDSNIFDQETQLNSDAEFFSEEDSYAFDFYKIKSKVGITEIVRDILGI